MLWLVWSGRKKKEENKKTVMYEYSIICNNNLYFDLKCYFGICVQIFIWFDLDVCFFFIIVECENVFTKIASARAGC